MTWILVIFTYILCSSINKGVKTYIIPKLFKKSQHTVAYPTFGYLYYETILQNYINNNINDFNDDNMDILINNLIESLHYFKKNNIQSVLLNDKIINFNNQNMLLNLIKKGEKIGISFGLLVNLEKLEHENYQNKIIKYPFLAYYYLINSKVSFTTLQIIENFGKLVHKSKYKKLNALIYCDTLTKDRLNDLIFFQSSIDILMFKSFENIKNFHEFNFENDLKIKFSFTFAFNKGNQKLKLTTKT